MKIKNIKVGYLKCNCYILESDNNVLVIDPGDEYEKIKKELGAKKVKGILITHNHFDHIGCINNIVNDYKTEFYSFNNLEEKGYEIGDFNFDVIYTPGHSKDSITFYFKEENIMFTGDFLFYDTIGRCDLLESDYSIMLKSIKKISEYEDDIKVYPGHGSSTILGKEKLNNPYFN